MNSMRAQSTNDEEVVPSAMLDAIRELNVSLKRRVRDLEEEAAAQRRRAIAGHASDFGHNNARKVWREYFIYLLRVIQALGAIIMITAPNPVFRWLGVFFLVGPEIVRFGIRRLPRLHPEVVRIVDESGKQKRRLCQKHIMVLAATWMKLTNPIIPMSDAWKYLPSILVSRKRRQLMINGTYLRPLSYLWIREDWSASPFIEAQNVARLQMLASSNGVQDELYNLMGRFKGDLLIELLVSGAEKHVFTFSAKEQKQLLQMTETFS